MNLFSVLGFACCAASVLWLSRCSHDLVILKNKTALLAMPRPCRIRWARHKLLAYRCRSVRADERCARRVGPQQLAGSGAVPCPRPHSRLCGPACVVRQSGINGSATIFSPNLSLFIFSMISVELKGHKSTRPSELNHKLISQRVVQSRHVLYFRPQDLN